MGGVTVYDYLDNVQVTVGSASGPKVVSKSGSKLVIVQIIAMLLLMIVC